MSEKRTPNPSLLAGEGASRTHGVREAGEGAPGQTQSFHAESAKDQYRDRWFKNNRFRVLRFWNNEVLGNPEGVLTAIGAELGAAPPHPDRAARGRPSPARGEGSGSAR
jgi:uncharacterized protein DUF559